MASFILKPKTLNTIGLSLFILKMVGSSIFIPTTVNKVGSTILIPKISSGRCLPFPSIHGPMFTFDIREFSPSIAGDVVFSSETQNFSPLPSLSISGSGKGSLLHTVRPNSVSCENRNPCILPRPKPVPCVSCQGYRRFAARPCRVFCFDTWISLLFLYPGVANWVFSFHTLMSWRLCYPVHIHLLSLHLRIQLLCFFFDIRMFSPLKSRSSKWSLVFAFDTRESQMESCACLWYPGVAKGVFSFYTGVCLLYLYPGVAKGVFSFYTRVCLLFLYPGVANGVFSRQCVAC